jgi:hypothetical protein
MPSCMGPATQHRRDSARAQAFLCSACRQLKRCAWKAMFELVRAAALTLRAGPGIEGVLIFMIQN